MHSKDGESRERVLKLRSAPVLFATSAIASGGGVYLAESLNSVWILSAVFTAVICGFAGGFFAFSASLMIGDRPLRLTAPLLALAGGASALSIGWSFSPIWTIPGMMAVYIGLAHVIRKNVPPIWRERGCCRACGSDMRTIPQERCPECGVEYPLGAPEASGRTALAGPRRLQFAVAGLLLAATSLPFLTGRVFESQIEWFDRAFSSGRTGWERQAQSELRSTDPSLAIDVLRNASSWQARTAAIDALEYHDDPATMLALVDAIDDPDDRVRRAAIRMLAFMKNSPLEAPAKRLLSKQGDAYQEEFEQFRASVERWRDGKPVESEATGESP